MSAAPVNPAAFKEEFPTLGDKLPGSSEAPSKTVEQIRLEGQSSFEQTIATQELIDVKAEIERNKLRRREENEGRAPVAWSGAINVSYYNEKHAFVIWCYVITKN